MSIGRPSSFRNATFESYEIPRNGITRKEAKETENRDGELFFFFGREMNPHFPLILIIFLKT
jgi:hypothetical protein